MNFIFHSYFHFILIVIYHKFPVITGLIAFSCSDEKANYTSISLVDSPECQGISNKIETKETIIQLVQKKTFREIDYFQCSLIASNHLFRCGKSIDTESPGGIYTEIIEISFEECYNMIKHKRFDFNNRSYKLNSMDVEYISATTHGWINTESSCTPGVGLTKDGIFHDRPVIQTEFKITKMIRKATVDLDDDKIIFDDGLKLKYSSFSGYSADKGFLFWEEPHNITKCNDNEEFTVLYQGISTKVKDINQLDNHTFTSYIIQMESYDFQIGLNDKKVYLCGLPAYSTEHPKLKIIEKPKNQDFILKKDQSIYVKEVNLLTYINSKLVYLMRHTGDQINSLYQKFSKERCETENRIIRNLLTLATISPIDFAYEYNQGPGTTAIVRGEVVYLIKCQPVEVQVDMSNMERCYAEFPVVYNGKQMYMNPRSRLLTNIGKEIDCLQEAPSKFKISGIWHAVLGGGMKPHSDTTNPHVISAKMTGWEFKPIRGFMDSGIYSPNDVDKLERFLMNPIEKEAVQETFIRSLEGKNGKEGTINLMNLYNSNFEDKIIDKITSKLSGWYKWQYEAGGTFGFILLCFFVIKIVKGLLNSMFNFKSLYESFGWGWKLLLCCWSNMTHKVVINQTNEKLNQVIYKDGLSSIEVEDDIDFH